MLELIYQKQVCINQIVLINFLIINLASSQRLNLSSENDSYWKKRKEEEENLVKELLKQSKLISNYY